MNSIEKALKREQDKQGETLSQPIVEAHQSDIPVADTAAVISKSNETNTSTATIKSQPTQYSPQLESDNSQESLRAASNNLTTENIDSLDSESSIDKQIKSKSIKIDLDLLEGLGFLVPNNTHTIINEEYRQIKRPLIKNIKGKTAHNIDRANVIQVTSSLQGEGKTFTAINLALAFAMEMDFNVLLVDADTIKSSVTRTLINKTSELGLTDYLTGDIDDLSEVMLTTNIPKLSILPAGRTHLLSPELLNSEYMDKLIVEFSQRYDNRIVIFDSPPLLQTNDSRILSQKVGQLVFVCEQNKTVQSAVKNALSLLDPEMVVGVVMNKTRNSSQQGYYGYYAAPN